jgi:hypothetical protein
MDKSIKTKKGSKATKFEGEQIWGHCQIKKEN